MNRCELGLSSLEIKSNLGEEEDTIEIPRGGNRLRVAAKQPDIEEGGTGRLVDFKL